MNFKHCHGYDEVMMDGLSSKRAPHLIIIHVNLPLLSYNNNSVSIAPLQLHVVSLLQAEYYQTPVGVSGLTSRTLQDGAVHQTVSTAVLPSGAHGSTPPADNVRPNCDSPTPARQ